MWESPSSLSSRLPVVSSTSTTPATAAALALTLATVASTQSTVMAPAVHANEIWRYITKCRQLMVWVLSDDDNAELRGAMFPALSSTPVTAAEIKQLAHLYHNVVLDVCPWIVHSRSYHHVLIDEHESFEALAQAVDAAIIEACRGGGSAVSTPRASWHRRSVAEVLHPVAEESSAAGDDAGSATTRSPGCTTARLSESTAGFEIRTPPLEAFGAGRRRSGRSSTSYAFTPHDPDEAPRPFADAGAQMQLWESESERAVPVPVVAAKPKPEAPKPKPKAKAPPEPEPAAADASADNDITPLQLPAPAVEIKIHPASVVSVAREREQATPTTLSPPQSAQTFPGGTGHTTHAHAPEPTPHRGLRYFSSSGSLAHHWWQLHRRRASSHSDD